jgi:hypothetical protein
MKKIVSPMLGATALLVSSISANAANDEYKGCLAYEKPVTLTGTVLVRKINYGKDADVPPEGSVPFPLLVLDQPICTAPLLNDKHEIDEEAEGMEWALHVADTCVRTWPTVSRVKVTGTLFHADNWHHHSRVLVLAKQVVRLDGQLPACVKEPVEAKGAACEGDVPDRLQGICKAPEFRAYVACVEKAIPKWDPKGPALSKTNILPGNSVLTVLMECEPVAKKFGKKYGNDFANALQSVANQRVSKRYGTEPLREPSGDSSKFLEYGERVDPADVKPGDVAVPRKR